MADDLAGWAALAEGLKEGLGAFQDQKRYIEDQAYKKRKMALDEQAATREQRKMEADEYTKGIHRTTSGGYENVPLTKAQQTYGETLLETATPEGETIPSLEGLGTRDIDLKRLTERGLLAGEARQRTDARLQEQADRTALMWDRLNLSEAQFMAKHGLEKEKFGVQKEKTEADIKKGLLADKRAKENQALNRIMKGVYETPDGELKGTPVSKIQQDLINARRKDVGLGPIDLSKATLLDLKQLGMEKLLTAPSQKGKIDLSRERLDMQKQSLAMRGDATALRVAKHFDSDPLAKQFLMTHSVLMRGIHTLENPPQGKVTPQLLSEINAEITKAIAGAGVATEGSQHRQEMKTLEGDWARAMQFWRSKPQNVAAPETIDYIKKTMDRLRQGIEKNINDNAERLGAGMNLNTKQLQDVVNAKKGFYKGYGGGGTEKYKGLTKEQKLEILRKRGAIK